ncbi:MAG: GNAT family N-acetyltransferase [Clostridia bacterium]|nr:GNAT family N-acetyltransferase [Clostridia bacterium]
MDKKMMNLIIKNEIEYIKKFSEAIESENYIKFTDESIPDMYSHNFILLQRNLSDDEIKKVVTAQIETYKRENKNYLNVEFNYELNEDTYIDERANQINYIYMTIDTGKYHLLKENSYCQIKEAITEEILKDGALIDIEVNNDDEDDFAIRRCNRKQEVYRHRNGVRFFVCYNDNMPVGMCELFIGDKIAKIEEFDVLKKYQRKGIGTAIIRHLLKICNDAGISRAYVVTSIDDSAKEMYQKCGFKEVGYKKDLYYQFDKFDI